MRSKWKFSIISVLLITGCAFHTAGTESLEMPSTWHESPDPAAIRYDETASPSQQWWKGILGLESDIFIENLLKANIDIAKAEKRLLASRALEKEVRSSLWPLINLTASFSRLRPSEHTILTETGGGQISGAPGQTLNRFNLRSSINYDLDFWGRNRYAVRSAKAITEAREAEVKATTLLVIGDALNAYMDFLLANDLLRINNEMVELQLQHLRLIKARESAGISTVLDLSNAKIRLSQAEALFSRSKELRSLAAHRLSFLLGEVVGRITLPTIGILDIPHPEPIPLGLPSTVVNSRPDVKASEARIRALSENIGRLKAELLPSFTLIGSAGLESQELSNWLKIGSRTWLIGLSVFETIFDSGARKAKVEVSQAEMEEAVLTYRQTVLRALTEVEDALVRIAEERKQRESLRQLHDARYLAFKAMNARWQAGIAEQLNLIESQSLLLEARADLAAKERDYRDALLSLYLAIGGY